MVPHNITPSGVAYALPHKSRTGTTQIPDEDDDKYMTLNSIGGAVTQDPDPDDGQAYHAYENPDPPDPDVIVLERRSSKGKESILTKLIQVYKSTRDLSDECSGFNYFYSMGKELIKKVST